VSFFERLRNSIGNGTTGRKGIAGFRPAPGPFDLPPEEPVELDETEIPWELREDDVTERPPADR